MAIELDITVKMSVKVEHDGPTEGLEQVKYDVLLSGIKLDPNLRGHLTRALNRTNPADVTLGWIDDNVQYFVREVLDLDVTDIGKVKEYK